MTKTESPDVLCCWAGRDSFVSVIRILDFVLVSNFVLRISDFLQRAVAAFLGPGI
jgi:hypothetical protein